MRRWMQWRGTCLLAVVLAATSGSAQTQQLNPTVSPVPKAAPKVVQAADTVKVADADGESSKPGRGAFATWWITHGDALRKLIARRCTAALAETTDDVQRWCRQYTSLPAPSSAATEYDLAALLESRALALAAFHARRAELLNPLRQLEELLKSLEARQSARLAAAAAANSASLKQSLNDIRADLGTLVGATGNPPENSALGSTTAAAGLFPSVDLNAVLQRLFSGLAAALQVRAEQEAVAYVLYEFERRVCELPKGASERQMADHQQLRYWLTNTCAAAKQGAYGGNAQSGGLTSISLLRRSVEEDLRQWPGKLAFVVLTESPSSGLNPAAPATRELVDAILQGTHPVRALEDFSRKLARLQNGVSSDVRPVYESSACLSAMPAAMVRSRSLVESTSNGLSLDPQEKGLSELLVALESPACKWFYSSKATSPKRFTQWLERKDGLLESSENIHYAAAELEALGRTSDELQRLLMTFASKPEAKLPESSQLASVGALFGRQSLAVLNAVSASLDSLQKVGLPDPYQRALEQAEAAITFGANMLEIVTAVMSRDFSTAYQALLKHQAIDTGSKQNDTGPKQNQDDPPACKSSDAVTYDAALADSRFASTQWRCSVGPCMCAPSALLQYGGLLVALADAKSSEQVQDVILAAAAPVGSWRLKQKSERDHTLVTLGGLVGFGPSWTSDEQRDSPVYPRLLVPFGVDFTLPGTLPFSFFVQGLDLGGYTTFSGSGRKSPRVLEAISPGLSFKASIPDTPFAFVAGAAYDLDAGGAEPKGAFRVSTGVALDVTLFILRND